MPAEQDWNLLADIGGTNARFAIQATSGEMLQELSVYSVAEYPVFISVLRDYLGQIRQSGDWAAQPQAVCLAVACPPDQDPISFTNSNWQFSRAELAQVFPDARVEVINDFSAIAYSIPTLADDDWLSVGGGKAVPEKPVVIIGAGTGLGVSTLLPIEKGVQVLAGEGGHISFAPVDEHEMAILRQLQRHYHHVSVERLLSGNGIVNIYRVLCELQSTKQVHKTAAQISQAAIQGVDEIALETLSVFCRVLGSTAGNLALINGALGGVYIAGGIVPRMTEFVINSQIRQRFEDKGRFHGYLRSIPLRIVVKDNPGLHGAMNRLKLA